VRATPDPPRRYFLFAYAQFVAGSRTPPSVPLRRAFVCPQRSCSPRRQNIFQNVFPNMFQTVI